MADPIRCLTDWPGMRGRRVLPPVQAGQIVRQDPMQQAVRLISRHELRVWFEPNWAVGRRLARRFPSCMVCSLPEESNLVSLRRIPAWRPKPDLGCV